MSSSDTKRKYHVVKRLLDVIFSFILIVFLSLPMLLIWIAVRLDTPGDGIFRQIRVGKDRQLFVCYKFRTMYSSAPPCCPSSKFCDAEKYITPVGKFLRKTSLDELPQLFNVLKGDMSLVGPRPLILAEREVHEGRRQNGVYTLRPGMTGLSQVNGRDNISDREKVEFDTRYLCEFGFIQDVRILAKTVTKVISGEGNREKNKTAHRDRR